MPQRLTEALAKTHHLMALGADIEPEEVVLLACTRWRGVRQEMGEVTLSRYSSLFGPYQVSPAVGAALELPRALNRAWLATTLTERGDRPLLRALDPTGVARAFPNGLPVREEGRVVDFMVAAARRLGGVVRFYGSNVMVAPVPDAALDLAVYSSLWMEPDAALAIAKAAVPRFEMGIDWSGLEAPQTLDRYALSADLGPAGTVVMEISGTSEVPGALREVSWAEGGAVSYQVKWLPRDPRHLAMEFPPPDHCAARVKMAELMAGIARVIYHTVGGEVLDSDGFPIDPADL
jgi:hypothetical protein